MISKHRRNSRFTRSSRNSVGSFVFRSFLCIKLKSGLTFFRFYETKIKRYEFYTYRYVYFVE